MGPGAGGRGQVATGRRVDAAERTRCSILRSCTAPRGFQCLAVVLELAIWGNAQYGNCNS